MRTYPKIPGPFKRHTEGEKRNQLIWDEWTHPEIEYLANLDWHWTEKVDGTNIRVHWDGYKVCFGGRTAAAQIPATLISVLRDMFPDEIMEQQFGVTEATLFGEGYGAKIQKCGGEYRRDQSFVLFDVLIQDWWLRFNDLEEVAFGLNIDVVPLVSVENVYAAIDRVRKGVPSWWHLSDSAEGLVGTTPQGLLTRSGQPIKLKIKSVDFKDVDFNDPSALP